MQSRVPAPRAGVPLPHARAVANADTPGVHKPTATPFSRAEELRSRLRTKNRSAAEETLSETGLKPDLQTRSDGTGERSLAAMLEVGKKPPRSALARWR